ncbi:MAG: bifunctional glutamate N-acetyltransferase/amino-acid acetyltransferase ArgJ, partial [Ilumatobacteraceae bacterium]
AAGSPAAAAGVFTRSRFAGPSVIVSREHLRDHRARAIVVVSKNANVATGRQGLADTRELVAGVAARLGCDATDVIVASTGVIGRPYPMDRIRAGIERLPTGLGASGQHDDDGQRDDVDAAARGIMTTDTVPKIATATVGAGPATVVGFAKGVGMIEPDMATLIVVLLTDAAIEPEPLDRILRSVIDRTLNCVSIDTDTSTSDTAVVLASGAAGPVDHDAFETALHEVALSLTKQVARDGEGAETLIEVHVDHARDHAQAKRVAKAIVNSPLVKTAVHGADPNWGRVAMAIGKCSGDVDIDPDRVVIRFGATEVYPDLLDDDALAALSGYMAGDEVLIHVELRTGTARATVWGCDLTDGYVRINADYTT